MISGIIVTLILYPLDTVKRTMQTNGGRGFKTSYLNSVDCLYKIHDHIGTAGLYRGSLLYLITAVLSSYT